MSSNFLSHVCWVEGVKINLPVYIYASKVVWWSLASSTSLDLLRQSELLSARSGGFCISGKKKVVVPKGSVLSTVMLVTQEPDREQSAGDLHWAA